MNAQAMIETQHPREERGSHPQTILLRSILVGQIIQMKLLMHDVSSILQICWQRKQPPPPSPKMCGVPDD